MDAFVADNTFWIYWAALTAFFIGYLIWKRRNFGETPERQRLKNIASSPRSIISWVGGGFFALLGLILLLAGNLDSALGLLGLAALMFASAEFRRRRVAAVRQQLAREQQVISSERDRADL